MSMTEGTVPWPDELALQYARVGWWRWRDLGAEFAVVAAARPDATALWWTGPPGSATGRCWPGPTRWPPRLAGLGLRPGDRIVVQLPNGWPFVVLTLACLRAGIVPVMALPAHRRHELAYLCEHSGARALAVPDVLRGFDHQQMAEELLAGSATLEHILVVGQDVRHQDLTALCAEPETLVPVPDPPDPQPGVAVFLLSGGTTGLPKLIPRTHADYLLQFGWVSGDVAGFDADTVYLVAVPISHNFPLACPVRRGGTQCPAGGQGRAGAEPRPGEALFALVERERVTPTWRWCQRWTIAWLNHPARENRKRTTSAQGPAGRRLAAEPGGGGAARAGRGSGCRASAAGLRDGRGAAELHSPGRRAGPGDRRNPGPPRLGRGGRGTGGRRRRPRRAVGWLSASYSPADRTPSAATTVPRSTIPGVFTADGYYRSGDLVRQDDGRQLQRRGPGRGHDQPRRGEDLCRRDREPRSTGCRGSPRSPPSPRPTPNSASGSASSSSRSPGVRSA